METTWVRERIDRKPFQFHGNSRIINERQFN